TDVNPEKTTIVRSPSVEWWFGNTLTSPKTSWYSPLGPRRGRNFLPSVPCFTSATCRATSSQRSVQGVFSNNVETDRLYHVEPNRTVLLPRKALRGDVVSGSMRVRAWSVCSAVSTSARPSTVPMGTAFCTGSICSFASFGKSRYRLNKG